MRPSSVELLERIAEALDQTVLPALADDRWAASVVRSSTTLLLHLAKRVQLEAPVLLADNDDARQVLAALLERLAPPDVAPELAAEIANLVGEQTFIPSHDLAALDTRNRRYQEAMERLLQRRDGQPPDVQEEIRRALRSYFKRRMEREREMYFPSFTGPPF